MRINYSDYFKALGFKEVYADTTKNNFNPEAVITRIKTIKDSWKEKYPNADLKTQGLRFDNLVNFNQTFTTEIEFLNMEA
ncbi:MAG: hypothetical protein WDO71_08070 [Bacteroidota bacterium]